MGSKYLQPIASSSLNYKYININININIYIYILSRNKYKYLIQTDILSGNKYKYLIQTNILSGNGMTNSMQATLSKAAIYTKQPTREWEDPYLTWGCANVLLRLYESGRGSERSNVLLLNMYESLWKLYEVMWELLKEVLWYKSCWERLCDMRVVWELSEVWDGQNIL